MNDVAVVGVGQTGFVQASGVSIREMAFSAFQEAVDDSGNLEAKDIDASVVSSAPEYDKQRSPAGAISEYLGLNPRPSMYAESLCSSGTTAVRVAYGLIKSGLNGVVAVVGFQKMSELSAADVQERMGRGADIVWETPFGLTMPDGYALFARAHMQEYGTTREQLAAVKVKSGKYAALNPKAAFQREVSMDDVLGSRMIADPLRSLDCTSNADGATCVILANAEDAKKITDTPIWVKGIGSASDALTVASKASLTGLGCASEAASQAYRMAGVGPGDIDVAEVHDCFTISEILAYEDLGFCKRGEGGKLVQDGETYIGGRIPVNVDGGLLGKGHPIGATGGSQIRTIVRELRGDAGRAQVKGAELGLVHNIGGIGLYGNVVIMGR
ncbi:MAG: thiolase domain-containing protein [Nitrososphaerota archaeon]|nr:thiolase domain-containing protein [Nitrososphaerota archaeon]